MQLLLPDMFYECYNTTIRCYSNAFSSLFPFLADDKAVCSSSITTFPTGDFSVRATPTTPSLGLSTLFQTMPLIDLPPSR
mmetsp:Transcript_3615/g.6409  ORF Transcript_3615/g.6409 Transcript_3615/m.6409 type:complete len:80 (+) Transcript_3615:121-360(+)